MPRERLRVAICGGGIGGLCLAVQLARFGNIDVQLYEAAAQFKEIGAGIAMWSRTWHIIELMGLAGKLAEYAYPPPTGSINTAFDLRRSDRRQGGFTFQLIQRPYGCIRFHRAKFLDVLVDHLPNGVANFNKRLVSYSYTSAAPGEGPLSLRFADGSSGICDILVGADGIKSCIRGQMYSKLYKQTRNTDYLSYVDPQWTGSIAYRGLVPVQQLMAAAGTKDGKSAHEDSHRVLRTPVMYCGKDKHIVCYTVSRGSLVNLSTSITLTEQPSAKYPGEWVVDCTQEELLGAYAGWEPEVTQLLKSITHPTKWALHHLPPLPHFVQDRVVLLGDAAHAMTPHQGAGAGQAIEDAYILAQLLSKATASNYDAYLAAYESVRLPATHALQKSSFSTGLMYQFNSEHRDDYGALGPAICDAWRWIDETKVEEMLDQAFEFARQFESEVGMMSSQKYIPVDSAAVEGLGIEEIAWGLGPKL